jgi:hypothetical protein
MDTFVGETSKACALAPTRKVSISTQLTKYKTRTPNPEPMQHGFHSHSMARDPTIKKEMAEARKIAQEVRRAFGFRAVGFRFGN